MEGDGKPRRRRSVAKRSRGGRSTPSDTPSPSASEIASEKIKELLNKDYRYWDTKAPYYFVDVRGGAVAFGLLQLAWLRAMIPVPVGHLGCD